MKTKLSEILKQQGLFVQDIKTRINNKQIFINGEPASNDIELECFVDAIDAGDFLFFHLVSNNKWLEQIKIFGLENIFDTNIENDLTLFLKNFILLKISKKQMLVLKRYGDNFGFRRNSGIA